MLPSTFIIQSHCHHSVFPSMKYLSKLSWNIMECLSTSPLLMPLSTDVARWAVKGANFEIPSTCAYMCQNLTWLDKTHAFVVWEGFKAKWCMSFLHNVWDRPRFHHHSWCNNVVLWAWASWFFTFCCQSSPYHMPSPNHISISQLSPLLALPFLKFHQTTYHSDELHYEHAPPPWL